MGLHCAAYRNGSRIPFRFRRGGRVAQIRGGSPLTNMAARASFRTKSIIGSIPVSLIERELEPRFELRAKASSIAVTLYCIDIT